MKLSYEVPGMVAARACGPFILAEQAVKRQVCEQSCHVVGRRTGRCRPPVVQTREW